MGEERYDPQRAAKMLSLKPEEVWEMLENGEIEGEWEDGTYWIPEKAVTNRLGEAAEQDYRRTVQEDPRVEDLPTAPPGS